MKNFRKDISFYERFLFIIAMLENIYIDRTLLSNSDRLIQTTASQVSKNGLFLLLFSTCFISLMGEELIYQKESKNDALPLLRKYGYPWFLILYTLYLVFYFWLDVWHLFFINARWEGMGLFLLKLTLVIYYGIKLHKLSAEGYLSDTGQEEGFTLVPSGDLPNMLCAAGLIVLLTVQFLTMIFTLSLTAPLPTVIELLQWVLLLYGTFGTYFRKHKHKET